ncbi:MAG TPA: TonB-dependent receptor [Vicinamibacterales bacterium]|nr:TonB-dependent receptor [Vicinamibacterales bacterium]
MTCFTERGWRTLVLVILVLATWASLAHAQGEPGTIAGTVSDSSGAVLKGAKVSVSSRAATVVTNEQGRFVISNVAPGAYTLTVTYVGFAPLTRQVEVGAGQTVRIGLSLKIAGQQDSVLVTAPRATGEAEAVNIERTADNIVQVLPAEVIRSLPNANMADALGRLPSVTLERDEGEGKYVQIRGTEPRLTNTTIDGISVPSPETDVRQIKFDAIPADIVQDVEINKTLQANMDGDGIGGSVNLVTKTAGPQPIVSLSGMSGFTPIAGGRGLTELSGTAGRRFGGNQRLGLLIGGTYDWNGRGIDDVEPVADVATRPDGSTQRYFESTDVRQYRYYRSRWGLTGSADYRLSDQSNIYLRGLYSDFKNYGEVWTYSINDNTPGIQLLDSNGCDTNEAGFTVGPCGGTPTFQNSIRRPDITIGTVAGGGKHMLGTAWLSWDVAGSRASDTNVSPGSARFSSTLDTSTCQYDPSATSNIYEPQFTPECYAEVNNPANFELSRITNDHGHTQQFNGTVSASFGKDYHAGSREGTLEVGGKFRRAHKYDDSYSNRLNARVSIPMTLFPNRFSNSNFYGGAYKIGPTPIYQDVLAFSNGNPGDFSFQTSNGTDPGNYDLVEKVSAGYVMNTIDFSSNARLVAGVRLENTDLATTSFDTETNTLSDHASGSYLNVLPSASLRVALTPDTNLRFAYSRALSRPDPVDIAQSVTFTTTGSPGSLKNTASLGNPSLKAEHADNFDVLFEHYLEPFGLVSGGFFYKRLGEPIVTSSRVLTDFQPSPIAPVGTYTVTQPFNAGSAWLSGFEAAYTQHLGFLPGPLGGLGISMNYGYTASRATGLIGRSDQPRLLRNAPNTWNISPTYDRGPVSIRAGLSYNQANIYSYEYQDGTDGTDPTPGGLTGPFGDLYFYSHLQVDAQGSVRLGHGLSVVMYGLNLTNEVFGFYQGDPTYMIQREFYKPSVAVGLRLSGGH